MYHVYDKSYLRHHTPYINIMSYQLLLFSILTVFFHPGETFHGSRDAKVTEAWTTQLIMGRNPQSDIAPIGRNPQRIIFQLHWFLGAYGSFRESKCDWIILGWLLLGILGSGSWQFGPAILISQGKKRWLRPSLRIMTAYSNCSSTGFVLFGNVWN